MGTNFEELYADCHAVGGMSKYAWEDDPKRLAFTLARYKHVARMLEGMGSVLEVGCSDGYGSRIVRQHVRSLVAVDLDAKAIVEAQANASQRWPIKFEIADIEQPEFHKRHIGFEATYCLDVLEHIDPPHEPNFLKALRALAPVTVIGIPSLESQQYASNLSKAGHVNCKTAADLRLTLAEYWKHVFIFTMNDEALGTGFPSMAHYLLALGVE